MAIEECPRNVESAFALTPAAMKIEGLAPIYVVPRVRVA
jgi:hypothetical protein